jgi:hypothetical protein
MTTNEERERQERAKLEELGVENVRIALTSNTLLPITDKGVAWRWLRDQDEKHRRDDTRYAQWTLRMAIVAAIAGTVAAVASVWPLVK